MLRRIVLLLVSPALFGCNAIVTTDGYRFDRPVESGSGGSTSTSSSMSGGGTGDDCDRFDRPDGQALGAPWIERDPDAFELVDGSLINTSGGPAGWKDNIAFYGDDAQYALEASMVVRFSDVVEGHPRVLVRMPPVFFDSAGFVQAYALGIDGVDSATLVKVANNTVSSGFGLDTPIDPSRRVRLTLRIEGMATVVLRSRVESEVSPGSWELLGENQWTDTNSPMFLDPGVAGVAMQGDSSARVDEFCVTPL